MNSTVRITSTIARELADFLASQGYSSHIILCDEHTQLHCLPLIAAVLPKAKVIVIPSGEEAKNLTTCQHIWAEMTAAQLDRKAVMINLGGGVIGDMGGFCASTYKRGIDFIQIPTTLLSQVDASVGGKLGIDFTDATGATYKNHIGVFREPAAVFIDTIFLKTLDPRELRSGFAEIIKHCLIADKAKWETLRTKALLEQDWNDLAAHSVAIKKKITTEDPLEKGLRKILNFGHTLGHAVESYFLMQPGKKLLHGEAIAIGMICESYLSVKKGFITAPQHESIAAYVLSTYGKTEILSSDIPAILPITLQDKKNEHAAVQFSLLQEIGLGNFNIPLTEAEMSEALEHYRQLSPTA